MIWFTMEHISRHVFNPVVQGLDVDEIVRKIDVNALVAKIDLDAVLERIDLNEQLHRVDVDALLRRVNVNELIQRSNLNSIIIQSSTFRSSEDVVPLQPSRSHFRSLRHLDPHHRYLSRLDDASGCALSWTL